MHGTTSWRPTFAPVGHSASRGQRFVSGSSRFVAGRLSLGRNLGVDAAYEWYENQRQGLGSAFRLAIDAAVELIAANPSASPVVRRSIRRVLLRRFPYALFYRVVGDEVVVEACIHAKQHPRAWRSRM